MTGRIIQVAADGSASSLPSTDLDEAVLSFAFAGFLAMKNLGSWKDGGLLIFADRHSHSSLLEGLVEAERRGGALGSLGTNQKC